MANVYNTIVVGGGPSGLFAALNINLGETLILEKNSEAGRKLLIAGSGRCNITHLGDIRDFFAHYGQNFRFLKNALLKFDNYKLIDFFKINGLGTIADKNGKVFPFTENSDDVLNLLLKKCKDKGVRIKRNCEVTKIIKSENGFALEANDETFNCVNLIIATGGKSYPDTGSTGSGYKFAKMLGHSIVEPKPALSPIFVKNYSWKELSGVSLAARKIYLYRDNKKINECIGDIGFTFKGVTGPGIIDFSRYIEKGDVVKINLLNENPDDLRNLIIKTAEREGSKTLQTLLKKYDIPNSLMKAIFVELKTDPAEKISKVSSKLRNSIVSAFCEYPFEVEKIGGFNMAMVTAGGISLKEVSSKSMESKLVKNLYFVGEVLDVDGDTGGYNLQAAFSTAYIAAESINKVNNEHMC